MKVIICYPPLSTILGHPTLGQNRQFQYFLEPLDIYPVVPAQAATLLQKSGHEVIWLDCIAKRWSYEKFLDFIRAEKPNLIAFETKTPVIKQHWKIVNDLKKLWAVPALRSFSEGGDYGLWTVLFGDHVTALPEESFEHSQVDFVLTGGDYDFLLLNLCNELERAGTQYPVPSTLNLEQGIYYRENGQIRNTGKFQLNHDLNTLPFIDRDLTSWQLYAFNNGNYKRTPGTYIMSGRDCWWGKCTFCSWPTMYPEFRRREPENVMDEIQILIEKYRVREIMDDSGCFPVGAWLEDFCNGVIKRGINKKIYFDCNMRFGALSQEDFELMKKANFRLLLFGLESANQDTLDRLNKNLKVESIIAGCKAAAAAGLFPHITIMFGYPWESYADALNTLKLGSWLLKKGYAYTMQATMVIPYPGSKLFSECKEDGLLKTLDWDDYDMKQPVIKAPIPDELIMQLVQGMYRASFSGEFILRKLSAVRDIDDFKYYLRALKKVWGHIFDFNRRA
ncbi:MAG: radical SAM protein [Candidatus Omnitrophota bacterium]